MMIKDFAEDIKNSLMTFFSLSEDEIKVTREFSWGSFTVSVDICPKGTILYPEGWTTLFSAFIRSDIKVHRIEFPFVEEDSDMKMSLGEAKEYILETLGTEKSMTIFNNLY